MVSDVPFWESLWGWLSQWKFADISIIASLLIVAAARPAWLLLKVVIYWVFVSISSCRLIIRGCVRLWIWSNWDIGSALLGMVRHSWSLEAGTGSPGPRQVGLRIHNFTDSGNNPGIGTFTIQLPVDGVASIIEANDAVSNSFDNIGDMDKRQRYRALFQVALKTATEKRNAKQLENQARGKWFRSRAVARWISARIRRF